MDTVSILGIVSGVVMAVIAVSVLISRKIDKEDHHREMDQFFGVLRDHVAADDRRIGAIELRLVGVDEKLDIIKSDVASLLTMERARARG